MLKRFPVTLAGLVMALWIGSGVLGAGARAGNGHYVVDATAFMEWCDIYVSSPELECITYVKGMSDALSTTRDALGLYEVDCRPNRIQLIQLIRVFYQFLQLNPKFHHEPPALVFSLAMKDAFPCETRTEP